jgi:hypothetical protein
VHPLDEGAFDERHGKTETPAPAFFRARHAPGVAFVVEAGKVEDAVQHQDADFIFGGVAEGAGLGAGALKGNCQRS